MEGFVLVGGWPGSGKSTLSLALADELGIDCLAKDEFKEDLMDHSGAPATVEESRELGRAAVEATLRAAEGRTAAVIDSTWYPYALPLVRRLPGPFVEVRCRLDVALVQKSATTGATETRAILMTAAHTKNSGVRRSLPSEWDLFLRWTHRDRWTLRPWPTWSALP